MTRNAGETRRAETTKIGSVHEHAVGEADAPKTPGNNPPNTTPSVTEEMIADGWRPLSDFDPETFEGHYVWLLYDFPEPKGLTAVEGMHRSGRFWGRETVGWWGPENIMENGQPTHGMWIDGWIKGWRAHLQGPLKSASPPIAGLTDVERVARLKEAVERGEQFLPPANGCPKLTTVRIDDLRAAIALVSNRSGVERLVEADNILRRIVGNANEAMPLGPFDCIDNEGEPYQSQALADALNAGRDYLARAALDTPTSNEGEGNG